jgi:hypothetical protein
VKYLPLFHHFKAIYQQKQNNTRLNSSYPQLFPIRPGMALVFIRQRCRHIGFTDDFVTKRNNK